MTNYKKRGIISIEIKKGVDNMTIKEFIESACFYTNELCFEICSISERKYNLTIEELHSYYNEKIKRFDFFTTGDISGESYLTITFYI